MRETDIDKIDGDHVIAPHQGYEHGYHGYTPDDDDADAHTVAKQGPLAEEAYKKSDTADKPKPATVKGASK